MELSLEFLSHENTLVHRDSEAGQGDVSSDFPAMYMAVASRDYPDYGNGLCCVRFPFKTLCLEKKRSEDLIN